MTAPLSTNVDDSIASSTITTSDGTALKADGEFGTDGSVPSSALSEGDTVTTPTNDTISQYTVKAGDSLSQIAENFGVSVNTILWANNITDPSTIKEGTVLVILPVSGIQHTVRSGETLSSIAAKFGADAGDIAQFNGISATGALTAGSTIIIPGGEISSGADISSGKARSQSSSGGTTVSIDSKGKKSSKGSIGKESSSESESTTHVPVPSSNSGGSSGKMDYSDESGNPYRGGGGPAMPGFFTNPLPGAILTQGLHGLDAVDLGAHTGTPILAAANGTVLISRMGGWNGGYGNYVILDNGHGIETLYAHMSETKAQVGDTVSAGEVIGYVGMTGDATGPHLHFEVRGAQNPFSYCQEMQVCNPE